VVFCGHLDTIKPFDGHCFLQNLFCQGFQKWV
jgi:hypothetical protein